MSEDMTVPDMGEALAKAAREIAGDCRAMRNREGIMERIGDVFILLDRISRMLGKASHGFSERPVVRISDDEEKARESRPVVASVNDVMPTRPPRPSAEMREVFEQMMDSPEMEAIELMNEWLWQQKQQVLRASILFVWRNRANAWEMFKDWLAMTRAHAQQITNEVISQTDLSALLDEGTRVAGISAREARVRDSLMRRSGARAPICPDAGLRGEETKEKNRLAAARTCNRRRKSA